MMGSIIPCDASMLGPTVMISLNKAMWDRLERELSKIPQGLARVCVRAINKVATAARTEIVRAVVADLNLKTNDVRDRNVMLTKANYQSPEGRVRITGRRISLRRFGGRKSGRGISYEIQRGARKVAAGTFMATMRSGHVGAFARKAGQATRRGPKGQQLPIVELRGPSVPEAARHIPELAEEVLDRRIAEDLDKEIATQMALVIESARGTRQ